MAGNKIPKFSDSPFSTHTIQMVIIVIIFNLVLLYSYLSPNNFLDIIFINFPVVKVELKICMSVNNLKVFFISILILSFSFY